MQELHLVGYHDLFRLLVDKLTHVPCFTEGKLIIAEISINKYYNLLDIVNNKLHDSSEGLSYIKGELEAGLHGLGLNHKMSANIADLIDLKPIAIIPCGTDTSAEPGVYGSKRDKETLTIMDAIMNGPTSTLKEEWECVCKLAYEIISETGCETMWFGGNKHANYMANELKYSPKILYDFRSEQLEYNPMLKSILRGNKIINQTSC